MVREPAVWPDRSPDRPIGARVTSNNLRTAASLQIAGAIAIGMYQWTAIPALEGLRWPLAAVIWIAPFFWLLRSPIALSAVLHLPLAALALWSTWYLIAVNWSNDYYPALALSLGVVSTTLAAAYYTRTYGWDRLARVAAITIAALLVTGMLYRATKGEILSPDHQRFVGLTHGPTTAGRQAAVMVVAAIAGFRKRRHLQFAFVTLGILGVGLAVAKTAMFGLVVALAFYAYRSAGNKGRLRIHLLAVVALAAAGTFTVVIAGAPPDNRGEQLSAASAVTFTGRTEVWTTTLDLIAQRPFLGWGTGSSPKVYGVLVSDGQFPWPVTTAHNIWLQSLLEHGLVGAMLLVVAAVTMVTACRRNRDNGRDAMLVLFFVLSFTEAMIQYPGLGLLLVAGAAGTLVYPRQPAPLSSPLDLVRDAGGRAVRS